jgi:hypothetical protein
MIRYMLSHQADSLLFLPNFTYGQIADMYAEFADLAVNEEPR